MTTISVIGIGNMGSAIAGIAAKGGAQVQLLGRDAAKTAEVAAQAGATAGAVGDVLTGDIVVLAVPFGAVDELLAGYAAQLDGKIVVDITNPVDFGTFDDLVVPSDASAAAVIAQKAPGARVVKAFNTSFAAHLASGAVGDGSTTVLVAGDDQAAKDAVIGFVTAGGLAAEDAGSLKRARELESIGFLQISLAASERIAWTGGFALAR